MGDNKKDLKQLIDEVERAITAVRVFLKDKEIVVVPAEKKKKDKFNI